MSRIFGPHDPPAPAVPRRYPVTFRLTADGQPVTIGATLRTDGPVPHEAFVGETGAIRFADLLPGGYNVTVQADGYEAAWQPLVITEGQQESDLTIALTRRPVVVPPVADAGERGPLHIDGLAFKRQDGTVFPWHGNDDFALFQRFTLGQDINPILDERIALGGLIERVFGMFADGISNTTRLGPFFPTWTGQQLSAFMNLLASRGLRCEFTVFADAQICMPDLTAQRQHWSSVCSILSGHWNAVVELVNEPLGSDASKNGVHPKDFPRPTNILACSGKYDFEDGTTTLPSWVWDWTNTHTDRKPEWPRTPRSLAEIRDGFDWADGSHFPGTHGPVVADEPTGAAEAPRGDSRSSTPADFGYYAACAAQMGAGATFHSDDGIASRLFAPVQKDCARAFFTQLRYIPTDCQFAPYVRGGAGDRPMGDLPVVHYDLEEGANPAALRTYAKELGGTAWYVRIRPRGTTVARPGWRVVEEPWPGIGKAERV